MNFIKNTLVYLLLLVFDVKTIVNEAGKLENCVTKIGAALTETDESRNLLKLIDQSTVILKAFCSENLINFVDESDDELEVNEETKTANEKNDYNDIESDNAEYNDYYFYKSNEDKNGKTLMTFTPVTIYKGQLDLRELELFNNQEFFLIQGWVHSDCTYGHPFMANVFIITSQGRKNNKFIEFSKAYHAKIYCEAKSIKP